MWLLFFAFLVASTAAVSEHHFGSDSGRDYHLRVATIILVQLLFAMVATIPAPAHEAKPTAALPQGWSYPFACCANYDCRTAETGEVLEKPEGYVIARTGEVIPMTDKRVKDSPDGLFHWCAHQAGLDAGKTICLFVPPRSF